MERASFAAVAVPLTIGVNVTSAQSRKVVVLFLTLATVPWLACMVVAVADLLAFFAGAQGPAGQAQAMESSRAVRLAFVAQPLAGVTAERRTVAATGIACAKSESRHLKLDANIGAAESSSVNAIPHKG